MPAADKLAADERRLFADDFIFRIQPQIDTDGTQIWVSSEDHAFDLKPAGSEVEQKADLDAGGLQVVQQLGFVSAGQALDRLDLANDPTINEDVREVKAYRLTPVAHLYLSLRVDRHAARCQLLIQSRLVHLLEESGPELPLHLERSADDLFSQLAVGVHAITPGSGVANLCPICVHLWPVQGRGG